MGGLASLGGALFGALFIEFVPNLADQLTVSFGEGAKALPGAIYGALLILVMAALPTGGAGAVRAVMKAIARAVASPGRVKVENCGGAEIAAKFGGKENPHDQPTFISPVERCRRGLRSGDAGGSGRQPAGRHRHRDQDRPDHAL